MWPFTKKDNRPYLKTKCTCCGWVTNTAFDKSIIEELKSDPTLTFRKHVGYCIGCGRNDQEVESMDNIIRYDTGKMMTADEHKERLKTEGY